MRRGLGWSLGVAVVCAAWAPGAEAGFIGGSGTGDFKVFVDVSEMAPLMGTANFDEGPLAGPIALDTYAAQGMVFRTGPLMQIFPGSIVGGDAMAPEYGVAEDTEFPPPFSGGGVQTGQIARGGAVVTFTADVTQVGMVASGVAELHLTAWDKSGEVIVELWWVPDGHPGFFALDTLGRPITMLAIGNDQLDGSEPPPYTPNEGPPILSDSWMWSAGFLCAVDEDCDDHSVCTGSESCVEGYCMDGVWLDCESGDMCQIDSCDPVGGCMHDPITNCCVSDDDCPVGQVCEGGACSLPPDPSGDPDTGSASDATTDPLDATTTGEASTSGGETTAPGETSGETTGGAATNSESSGSAGSTGGAPVDETTAELTTTATPTSDGPGETSLEATTGAGGEAVDAGGCGCASTDTSAGLLALVGPLVSRRRRRIHAR